MKKEVMILTGAGQIGMAIARRIGGGMKIAIGDRRLDNAKAISQTMNNAGFDTVPFEMDLSSRESILALIAEARKYGEISMLVNAAGVSPSQASIETILRVDLYGTAVLLEEVGTVVIPFCTHEGSGLSSTEKYIAEACKGATVAKGLAVRGATAQNNREQARKTVDTWIENLK